MFESSVIVAYESLSFPQRENNNNAYGEGSNTNKC